MLHLRVRLWAGLWLALAWSWAYLGRRMELAAGTNLHKLRPISISTVQGTIGRRKLVAGRSLIKPFFLLSSCRQVLPPPQRHSPAPPASAHGSPQELPPAPGSPLPFPSADLFVHTVPRSLDSSMAICFAGRLRQAAAAASFTARRGAATSTEEYQRRNYAENASEYNTVMGSLVAQRRQGNVGFRFLHSSCASIVRRIAEQGHCT